MNDAPTTVNRYDRKKASTRAKIVSAGNRLFTARGFDAVSVDDIATEAGLAVRTLYLHFESKAAIMLAYHDAWVDAFILAILDRPIDEPIADTVEAALATLREGDWADNQRFVELTAMPPVMAFLTSGAPQLAGHILHGWTRAQDAIAADTRARGDFPDDSLFPRARAAAIFATWVATLLAFRDAFELGLVNEGSSHEIGHQIASAFGKGLD